MTRRNWRVTLGSRILWSTNPCQSHGHATARTSSRCRETRGESEKSGKLILLVVYKRFSSQQLERDAGNMIRRAENAMKTNWNDVNNAFRLFVIKMSCHVESHPEPGSGSRRAWACSSASLTSSDTWTGSWRW